MFILGHLLVHEFVIHVVDTVFGVVPGGVFSKGACPRGSDASSKIPRT